MRNNNEALIGVSPHYDPYLPSIPILECSSQFISFSRFMPHAAISRGVSRNIRNVRMRSVIEPQFSLGQASIAEIQIDPNSRDDIPAILLGLQALYTHLPARTKVFDLLRAHFANLAICTEASPEWTPGASSCWPS